MIVECKKCEAIVDAQIIASYQYEESIESKYVFLICPKCRSPFLVDSDYLFGETTLFPPDDNRINPSLPEPLKASYKEALSCYKAKAHTAATIMCRKTLEGICAEHGVNERNLVSGLNVLKENGVIDNRLYEWADALRISGNEAAHDVGVRISAEDARDIIEFTNALLEYIFTFRDKFEEFKSRRGKKISA